uniref:Uncharacterized protein n=1 Tax=viral metagenome TaxID=1070528 RepID=A0A6H1Z5K4_9ZZZZ
MKGIIETKTEKSWTNPEGQIKKFFDITIEGIEKKYGCWQYDLLAAKNIGDEIEFDEVEKNGRWSMKLAGGGFKGGGGGFSRAKSPEEVKNQAKSFAASYAKDIVVSLINQGRLEKSTDIDASLLHWFNFFKGILEA